MKISEVRLKTGDLPGLQAFYEGVLGLPVVEAAADTLAFQVGSSRLVFELEAGFQGVYHFAFDIPENQIDAAREWLDARVPIARGATRNTDIVHFPNWNAHSLYFFDPAGSILELIARHNQPNASTHPFSVGSLLSISEIGLVTDDVSQTRAELHAALGLEVYNGPAGDEFAAVGDELGLLIVVKRGRIWFSGGGSAAEVLPLSITLVGNTLQDVPLAGLPYHLHSQPEVS